MFHPLHKLAHVSFYFMCCLFAKLADIVLHTTKMLQINKNKNVQTIDQTNFNGMIRLQLLTTIIQIYYDQPI